MKKYIGIIGICAVLSSSVIAQEAQTRVHHKKEMHGDHEGQRFLDLPGITEEQKAKLKAIFQETRKANQPRHEEMRVLKEKLRTLKTSENPNQQEINSLIDKTNALRAEMEKTRTAGELKAKSILTPEQQEALRAKAKEHMRHRREHKVEQRKMAEPVEMQ